ncbi:hypothetical protein GCM10009741_61290 [Kribbella lupini]|uniref:Uncharacterized protein n=1 Tax=Kribbella lupini TaxID=291602 RepID=A0ABN2BXC2_9ACTN
MSRSLRWFRPSLDEASTPTQQLEHLAQHRLCPAIDQGDAAPVVTALRIAEEALASADLDGELDQALTLSLIETVSNWCSWPEAPPEAVATIEAAMGPLTRARWDSVRNQGTLVADWIRAGGAPDRLGELPATYRKVENADLRFLTRSNLQYVDETMAVGTPDRLRHELATGQGM